jgi:hypothetical protein
MKNILTSILLILALSGYSQSSLTKGLVFHWKGDENSKNVDEISKIAGQSTATYPVLDRRGNGRRYWDFDGVNDYIEADANCLNTKTNNYSIIVRFKPKSYTNAVYLIDGRDAANDGIRVYISTATTLTVDHNGILTIGSYDFTLNTQYTIAVVATYNSTTKIYINGTEVTYTAQPTINTAVSTTTTAKLGANVIASVFSNMTESMCRIFNYALTPTQITNYSKPEYPIEWVDRGATGVNLMTNTITNHATFGYDTFDGASATGFHSANSATKDAFAICVVGTIYITKSYRFTATYTTVAGNTNRLWIGRSLSAPVSGFTYQDCAGNGSKNYTFTVGETLATCYFNTNSIGTGAIDQTVSNLSLTQLGCILDLNAEGLARYSDGTYNVGYWTDKTNQLTATVSGAVCVIPPESNLGSTWFNGTTGHIDIAGMNGLMGALTLAVRIRPVALGGCILTNTKVKLYVNASGYLTFSRDGSTYINSGAASIAINNTYNVLITSTTTGVTNFYINGVLSGTANQAAGTPASGTTWIIGSDGTNFFTGTVKKLSINGELLDTDRIKLINETN